MRAIILAAGSGTRMGIDMPKCLLEVEGRPIISRTVDILLKRNIKVAVCVGFQKEKIMKELGDRVTYIPNFFFDVTNSIVSLWFARDLFDGDTMVFNGDVLCDEKIIDMLIADPREVVCLSDKRLTDKIDDDYYKVSKEGLILKKERRMAESERNALEVGNFKISARAVPAFLKQLDTFISNNRHRSWAQDVVYSLIEQKIVHALDVAGLFWAELDRLADYYSLTNKDLSASLPVAPAKTEYRKLFTVGPVEKSQSTLYIASKREPYFRTKEFSNLVLENERHIKRLLNANEYARALFFNCSGTGGMEASVINAFDSSDKLLIINGGTFGQRFCDICDVHAIPYDAITIKDLDNIDPKGYTGLLINMHETSTGQLYPMEKVGEFCRRGNIKLVVDMVSSFMADEFDFDKIGADMVILSTGKGLALQCGMACVVLSGRMILNLKPCKSFYFDFKTSLADGQRGQTPFTPAISIMYQLNERIKDLDIKEEVKRTHAVAEAFRANIKCKLPDYPLSNALTPVFIKNAKSVYETLKTEHGYSVNPSGGDFADTMLRVGHLGDLNSEDVIKLAQCINSVING